MNAPAILSLISDLYQQVAQLTKENVDLKQALAAREKPAE